MIDMSTTVPGFAVRIRKFCVGRSGTWFAISYGVTHYTRPQPYFDRLFPGVAQIAATWRRLL